MTASPTAMTPSDRRALASASFASWAVAALAIAAGAAAVCPAGACRVPEADRRALDALAALGHPSLDAFFAAATWLGSITVLLPASLVLAWRLLRREDRAGAVLLPLAVGGAWLIAQVGKLLVARPRPDLHAAVIAMPEDLSFPSSHAMVAAAFVVALAFAPRTRVAGWSVAAAALVACVVALSRAYLQVHYPSDVVVGAAAGAAWALGLGLLARARR